MRQEDAMTVGDDLLIVALERCGGRRLRIYAHHLYPAQKRSSCFLAIRRQGDACVQERTQKTDGEIPSGWEHPVSQGLVSWYPNATRQRCRPRRRLEAVVGALRNPGNRLECGKDS